MLLNREPDRTLSIIPAMDCELFENDVVLMLSGLDVERSYC